MILLPRRAVRGDDFLDAHVFHTLTEVHAVDPVVISYQEARRFVIREGLDDLLAGPSCGRVGRDVEVNDPTAIMSKDDEAVQQLKTNGRHDEEIDGCDVTDVVFQEGPPGL